MNTDRDPMQTIIARAKALVRAVSISGTDDVDDWLIAAIYAGCIGFAVGMLVEQYVFSQLT